MKKIVNKVKKSEFTRNIIKLVFGTSIGQLIMFLAAPILTRIYSPEDFSVFGVCVAFIYILQIISNGKYEEASLLPKENTKAANLVCVSIISSTIFAILTTIILYLTKDYILERLTNINAQILFLTPFGIIIISLYNILMFWNTRFKKFKNLFACKIIQPLTNALTAIICGYYFNLNTLGLIIAIFTAVTITSIILLIPSLTNKEMKFWEYKFSNLKQTLLTYKKFPLFLSFSFLMENATLRLPIIILSGILSHSLVGMYTLMERVLITPIFIFSMAIKDVFNQKAAEDFKKTGSTHNIYKNNLILLSIIAIFPCLILAIWGPDLFAIVFGEKWRFAGEMAKIMTPALFTRIISFTLIYNFQIHNKQDLTLIFQTLTFIAVLVGLYLTSRSLDITTFLWIYSISDALIKTAMIIKGYQLSKKTIYP